MATVKDKLNSLSASVEKAREFVAAGGDVNSPAASAVWMNLMGAFERVADAFGYDIAKPGKRTK